MVLYHLPVLLCGRRREKFPRFLLKWLRPGERCLVGEVLAPVRPETRVQSVLDVGHGGTSL